MYRVLIMCHANRWRSPLAHGCMQVACAEEGLYKPEVLVELSSAGFLESGRKAGKPVREVARELGFSLENHRSTSVTLDLIGQHDAIVVMDKGNFSRLLKVTEGQAQCAGKSVFFLGHFCNEKRERIEDLAFISPRTKPEKFAEVVSYINEACRNFVATVIAPRARERQDSSDGSNWARGCPEETEN